MGDSGYRPNFFESGTGANLGQPRRGLTPVPVTTRRPEAVPVGGQFCLEPRTVLSDCAWIHPPGYQSTVCHGPTAKGHRLG